MRDALGASPHGLEDVHRSDDVHGGAQRWVPAYERHLQRGEVDDGAYLPAIEHLLDARQVGDVPGLDRQARPQRRRDGELDALRAEADVEAHNRKPVLEQRLDRPGADAAVGTCDQDGVSQAARPGRR